MKPNLALSLLVLVWSLELPCHAEDDSGKQQEARRHVEKGGGFSFVVPQGWEAREIPGYKHKFIIGPDRTGFASNINVVDEAFDGTLEAYVKATKELLPKVFKKYRLVAESEFKYENGHVGARLIIESEQSEKLLRQTFYLVPTAKAMFVVTCSTLADGGEKLDGLFESSIKTFRFEKK